MTDFGNTIQMEAAQEYRVFPIIGDLSGAKTVSKMLNERFNLFGPSASGYLRSAYEKLKEVGHQRPSIFGPISICDENFQIIAIQNMHPAFALQNHEPGLVEYS